MKQREFEIIQDDIEINQRVQQELAKLYQQVLSGDDAELKVDEGKGQKEQEFKTLRDALENVKGLMDELGTGIIEQDDQIYLKITEEQRFIDETFQKVRDRLKEALGDNIEIKPVTSISTKNLI